MSRQHTTREAITDGVITAKVRAALAEDPITASYDIYVETMAGIVELTGFVDTTSVSVEAIVVAKRVHGVLQVQDSLDLRCFG
ncbi:MAG: BON domain-containing protein [Pseudomonadota bacterium]|nr:BON domain-containing protein [Pseudomonadota bacterium]